MNSAKQSDQIGYAPSCKRPRVALQDWKRSYLVCQTGPVRQDIGCSCAQTALRAGKICRVKFNARDGKKRKTAPAKCGLEGGEAGGRVNRLETKARGYV
jgi:hypothetical protein